MQRTQMRLEILCVAFLCAFWRAGASGPQLGQVAREPLGIHIGKLIQAGAQEGDVQHTQFRKAFAQRWRTNHEVLLNRNVSEIIFRANDAADTASRDNVGGACVRNWNAPCPDGWAHYPESDVCKRPLQEGPCSTLKARLSVAERQQFAHSCSAPWPCDDACGAFGKDYAAPCPAGWTGLPGGYCKANAAGKSRHCPSIGKFDTMTVGEKQELSQRCNVTWPCLQPCLQDFHALCPEQWHEVELNPGVCAAPATYTGTCDFIANIGVMSPAQKRAFASQCSISFPCARG